MRMLLCMQAPDRRIGQLMSNATLCHEQVRAQDSLALMVSQIEHVWQASSKRLDLVHEDIPAVQVTLHIMCAMSGYQCNRLWFQCKRFWQQCKWVLWAGGGGGGGGGAAGEWAQSTRADIHAANERD